MDSSKKVSVIIPVFNSEKTICRCIESVINQTYKNIEIIIIDDGSTDNTKKILEKYLNIKNLLLIYNSNNGVSYTRNIGLKNSTGDYIIFLDADDWLEYNMIEKLVICKENNNVDLIRFNYYIDKDNDKNIDNKMCIKEEQKNCKLYIDSNIINYYFTGNLEGYVWLLFIDKNIITEFENSIKMMEDFLFILNLLKKAKTIYFLDEPLYHYYFNECGISKSSNNIEKKINDIIFVTFKSEELFLTYNGVMLEAFFLNQANLIYMFYCRMIKNRTNKDIDMKKINYQKIIILLKKIDSKKIGIQRRIGFFLIRKKLNKILKIYIWFLGKIGKYKEF